MKRRRRNAISLPRKRRSKPIRGNISDAAASSSPSPSEEDETQRMEVTPSVAAVDEEVQCSICATDRLSDEYPTEPITSTCTHATTDVCTICIRTYINSELSSRASAALFCPVCKGTLSYFDVMRTAAPEDFNRYDERVTIASLQNEPGFRWCPQPGCPGGQIQAYGDAEPIVTCNICQQRFCYTHRVPWHTGLTCARYDEDGEETEEEEEEETEEEESWEDAIGAVEENDKLAASPKAIEELETTAQERERRNYEVRIGEAHVQSIAKRCPECNSPTEREGGCKHMTCLICGLEWCWECRGSWIKGHLRDDCMWKY